MEHKSADDNHHRRSSKPTSTTTTGDGADPAMWNAFADNFQRVQTVLDRNRVLIGQVNENHRSKQHENMVKNVAIIHEINDNISKVASLYSDFSSDFAGALQNQRNPAAEDAVEDAKSRLDDKDDLSTESSSV